jgi:hypothetical protein
MTTPVSLLPRFLTVIHLTFSPVLRLPPLLRVQVLPRRLLQALPRLHPQTLRVYHLYQLMHRNLRPRLPSQSPARRRRTPLRLLPSRRVLLSQLVKELAILRLLLHHLLPGLATRTTAHDALAMSCAEWHLRTVSTRWKTFVLPRPANPLPRISRTKNKKIRPTRLDDDIHDPHLPAFPHACMFIYSLHSFIV